ncbi:(Na+)-NQR maturation NqrM [Cellvibrio japonicus]|uniref:ApbE family protein n=1 Tax=Cellvibrio japonicus (strain Ueda107) TaxID=498211 RepID=B3PFQ8_CELJU|nr:(Na+)-NQR maturation NqrM [Cellvibrio japonicus]ACE84119.1 conserved hypothetical protein [Cellvibrio japonicus Ueda107]
MAVMIVTLIVMLFVALALSLSALAGRKPVSGSCGGVGKALGQPDYVCPICGDDEAKCEAEKNKDLVKQEPKAKVGTADLSYDATKK